MVVRHWQNHQPKLLTDPDRAPEPAKSVSTSRTGSHARYGVVTLWKTPSTILGFIACLILPIPHE